MVVVMVWGLMGRRVRVMVGGRVVVVGGRGVMVGAVTMVIVDEMFPLVVHDIRLVSQVGSCSVVAMSGFL